MKKTLLLLILFATLGGIATTQEKIHKNVIYFGTIDMFGIALCYERMLRQNLSLLVDTGAALTVAPSSYAVSRLRWYPFSDSDGNTYGFFVSGGLGYDQFEKSSSIFIWEKDAAYKIYGLLLSPGIGTKMGFGKPKGTVFSIGMDIDIVFGKKMSLYNDKTEFGAGFNPNIKLLLGFGF